MATKKSPALGVKRAIAANQKARDRQWRAIERYRARGINPKTARAFFLENIRDKVAYWQEQLKDGRSPADHCISGLAHSILAMLDGVALAAPGYAVRPINDSGCEGADISGTGLHIDLYKGSLRKRTKKGAA